MKLTSSTVSCVWLVLVIVSSINIAASSPVIRIEESTAQPPCAASVGPTSNGNKIASYNGVSFTYSPSLASEVESETKPASLLVSETDKPDGVVPAHTAFTFKGPYGSRHKSSFFTPEISIYNIQQYKEALTASTAYVQTLETDVQSLKAILATRPASLEPEVPFLPFGIDANQAFVSHLRYINFKNGRGLIFLTQFNIEPSLVNNQGLTYVFQGFTDDGLYYVSARFPVTLSFLPPGYRSKSFGKYSVSKFYGSDQKSNQANYKSYLKTIERKLADLQPTTFRPNLTAIENVVTSLCVMPK